MNGQLSLTGAVFRLEKQNARVPDPTNPGFNILAGTQRVEGFDLGVLGRITDDWQITAGYTYLDGKVKEIAAECRRQWARCWCRRRRTALLLHRIPAGRRVRNRRRRAIYISRVTRQNTAPFKIVPGYWTFDAMAKYDVSEKMSLQLNVNNIFDKYYYDAVHNFHVVPGAGRTALLTLNFKY